MKINIAANRKGSLSTLIIIAIAVVIVIAAAIYLYSRTVVQTQNPALQSVSTSSISSGTFSAKLSSTSTTQIQNQVVQSKSVSKTSSTSQDKTITSTMPTPKESPPQDIVITANQTSTSWADTMGLLKECRVTSFEICYVCSDFQGAGVNVKNGPTSSLSVLDLTSYGELTSAVQSTTPTCGAVPVTNVCAGECSP